MNEQNTNNFQFLPRPEAHVMDWDDLLRPNKIAVRDLLIRLDGAEQIGDEEEVASCFLVYGSRGTGKTTVLLSAKEAVCRPEGDKGFFKGNKEAVYRPEEDKRFFKGNVENDAQHCAIELKRKGIVWLDLLDLEPLPPKTNLLTTVLTRVRNALGTTDSGQKSSTLTSPFEEDADSARQLLGRLINDATLLWEDIQEPDTRSRANRQIAAAVIYADFRMRFKKAMKKLSEELGHRHGGQAEHCSIVLPIDNIDRSTDHLYSIIKLAQMVSCRHLWLVMSGDRQDIDSFLERAYWKELIRVSEGAGGTGKMQDGEDEAFVMARRQAAAASQKLLPPSHRIEIQLVQPGETLGFILGKDKSREQSIDALLKGIKLYEKDTFLKSLLDVREFVEDPEEEKKASDQAKKKDSSSGSGESQQPKNSDEFRYLTLIAKQALCLPARGVIDLWQLAYWVSHDDSVKFKAETIARTMLTNAIADSRLTSERGQYLQNKIIRQRKDGGTQIILENNKVTPTPVLNERFRFHSGPKTLPLGTGKALLLNSLSLTVDEDIVVGLNIPSISKAIDKDALSELIGAWLVVLHDILTLEGRYARMPSPAIWFISANTVAFWPEIGFQSQDTQTQDKGGRRPSHSKRSQATQTQDPHTYWLTVQDGKTWPVPYWSTFQSYDVFRQRWKNFIELLKLDGPNLNYPLLCRVLAFGLLSCVMKTFAALALNPSDQAEEEEKNPSDQAEEVEKKVITTISNLSLKHYAGAANKVFADAANQEANDEVEDYEDSVMESLVALYQLLNNKQNKGSTQHKYPWMKLYLDKSLPLLMLWLLLILFIQMGDESDNEKNFNIISKRWNDIWTSDDFQDLTKLWKWLDYDKDPIKSIIQGLPRLFEDINNPNKAELRILREKAGWPSQLEEPKINEH